MIFSTRRSVLMALGATAVACGVMSSAAIAKDKPDVVKFGFFGGPRPWIIGKAKGMFEQDLGTKVEWVQFGFGAGALNALAAEEVDISRLGSTPTVASVARGLPIDMIAISGVIETCERLIGKDGNNSVADLKGKHIAYPPESTAHYGLMAALKVANAAVSDVTLLSLQPAEMLDAWEKKWTTVLFVTHDIDEALFLADRVVVMSARPGCVVDDLTLHFPRPRNYDQIIFDPVYVKMKQHVLSTIRLGGSTEERP